MYIELQYTNILLCACTYMHICPVYSCGCEHTYILLIPHPSIHPHTHIHTNTYMHACPVCTCRCKHAHTCPSIHTHMCIPGRAMGVRGGSTVAGGPAAVCPGWRGGGGGGGRLCHFVVFSLFIRIHIFKQCLAIINSFEQLYI